MGNARAGRSWASALATGSALFLLVSEAQANGLAIASTAIGVGFIGGVAFAPVVIAVEALIYRQTTGAPWGRTWLAAAVANVAAIPLMAIGLFALAVVHGYGYESREARFGLLAVTCILGSIVFKTLIVNALNRQAPTARPTWRTALAVSAISTTLVIVACAALYPVLSS